MPDSAALIISTVPEIARILRDFLNHDGYRAETAESNNSLNEMLDRIRPRLVLVDVDHPIGFCKEFVDRARRAGAVVVAFSASRYESEVRLLAAPRNLAFVGLPLRVNRLRQTLRAAMPSEW